jgi:hypothetical protein
MCASSGCVRSLVCVLYCWPLLLPGCSRSLCACVCVCVCVCVSAREFCVCQCYSQGWAADRSLVPFLSCPSLGLVDRAVASQSTIGVLVHVGVELVC